MTMDGLTSPMENLWFKQKDHRHGSWVWGVIPAYKVGHHFLPIWATLSESLNVM